MDLKELGSINPEELSPTAKLNYYRVVQGVPVLQHLQEVTKEPMKAQEKYLMELLEDNKDTEYGRKYDFASIHSIEDYQKKVPITGYDDYAPYIYRETDHGESGLLSVYPIRQYNKSSGTMGTPKRIPMSEKAFDIFNTYQGKYLAGLESMKFGLDWIHGRAVSTIEAKDDVTVLKNGKIHAAVSAKSQLDKRDFLPLVNASPIEAVIFREGTNSRYLHARFSLMDKEVTTGSGTFSSIYLEMLKYIEKNWKMLVKDIREGTIDDSIAMEDEVRQSLLKKIEPMPERADELEAIFSKGFDEPFMHKVWPNYYFVSLVANGGFKSYAAQLKERYLGEIPIIILGYNASEGVFSVPYDLDTEDNVLVPDSVFFEFIPLEDNGDPDKAITMDKLEEGKEYEVIITNPSGFYRYRMRDAVKVVGKFNNTPTIEFLYRIDTTVSLMGEKTTETALAKAAMETAKNLGFELVDYSLYPDEYYTPPRYTFFLETGPWPTGLRPKEVRFELERQLAKANPSMGDKVKSGLVSPTKLNILEPETFLLYHELMVNKGAAPSQVKPPHVITNELQRKFFYGLSEFGVEVVK